MHIVIHASGIPVILHAVCIVNILHAHELGGLLTGVIIARLYSLQFGLVILS